MKIGSIDISYRMLIYAGAVAGLALALIAFWKGNADIRAESFYRDTIGRGLIADDDQAIESAMAACNTLIGLYPAKTAPRLYLGCLLFRVERYKDAAAAFSAVPESAPAPDRAQALIGAGVAAFFAAPKEEQAKAALECEKQFTKALELDKKSADAMTNLGLVQLWKGGPGALEAAEKWSSQALAAPEPASRKGQAQLYNLRGFVLSKLSQPAEAVKDFERAHAVRPEREDFMENRRLAALAGALDPKLPALPRREILTRIEREIHTYGKYQTEAYNVAGLGWNLLKGSPDYLTGPYVNAQRLFSGAMQFAPKDPRAYLNRIAILEERLADIAKQLRSPVTGIKGETPVPNPWTGQNAPQRTPEDQALIMEARAVLRDSTAAWQSYLDRTAPVSADAIDAKLHQLACIRRQSWLYSGAESKQRDELVKQALSLATELASLQNSGDMQYALGQVLYEKGDYSAAAKAFRAAKAANYSSPALDRLLNFLEQKAEAFDVRPREGRRWYGNVPLICATLKALAVGALKETRMSIDGQAVEAHHINSQVFHLPADTSTMDGEHKVAISVTDAFGSTVEFPPFSFGMDRKPPNVKVIPDGGGTVGNKPIWAITLSDVSGVDVNTVAVTLKSVNTQLPVNRELVKDGRYKVAVPELQPPVKYGAQAGESFSVGSGGDLQPGDYTLVVVVRDLGGNEKTDTKLYTVKK